MTEAELYKAAYEHLVAAVKKARECDDEEEFVRILKTAQKETTQMFADAGVEHNPEKYR